MIEPPCFLTLPTLIKLFPEIFYSCFIALFIKITAHPMIRSRHNKQFFRCGTGCIILISHALGERGTVGSKGGRENFFSGWLICFCYFQNTVEEIINTELIYV